METVAERLKADLTPEKAHALAEEYPRWLELYGQKMAALRHEAGLTQRELTALLKHYWPDWHLDYPNLSNVEQGHIRLSPMNEARVAVLLDQAIRLRKNHGLTVLSENNADVNEVNCTSNLPMEVPE